MLLRTVLIVVGVMAFTYPVSSQALTNTEVRNTTRPMTTPELNEIYLNKSWFWPTGAGYFSSTKNQFEAATDKGTNTAEGNWFLPGQGKMCFRADWSGEQETYYAILSCFSHRVSEEGVIYQRREPDGDWYIFRHSPPKKGDAINTLVPGNYVPKFR